MRALAASMALAPALVACQRLADFVKTDTGSVGGGNTFPGVSRPLGMVKLGVDVYNGKDSYSGYQADGVVVGFSMLHESGTGGAPKYGVVSQMPVIGDVENPLRRQPGDRAATDKTEVGYYKTSLASSIEVELAGTQRAGMYKYSFPGREVSGVVVDVSHVLPSFRGQGLSQNYLGGSITVGEDERSYTGYGDYDNGWNRAEKWRVFFCGSFDKSATAKTFLGDGLKPEDETLTSYSDEMSRTSTSDRLGAVFNFSSATDVTSRVGVSFISEDQACANVEDQIPSGTSLSDLVEAAKQEWEDEVLSKITTTDADPGKKEQLYTSLYFMNLLPTNKTGENPLWESSEPYYDDIFTFWDTFRCTTSLQHILLPAAYEELIRSWVDIWRHEGFMSDARSSLWNGAVQGGTNVDNVLADAYVKGVRGAIDWDDAFAAMVTDAEEVPPDNGDPRDKGGSGKDGRGALPDWLELGYISPRFYRSVSRAVEYAVNDFALHQVARGLGRTDEAVKYLERSRNWRNHWDPDAEALGQTGFVVPRDENGFLDQNPLSCGGCYWSDYYYQGAPWLYSLNAHHDMSTTVNFTGGADRFLERLDLTFQEGAVGSGSGTIFDATNEPSFGTPYLYHFINRQSQSVLRSRTVAKTKYRVAADGLPGNSDAGAMESWLLWNMIGMYPMTGQTTFLIGSPWFENLTMQLGNGNTLQIQGGGRGGGSADDEAFYVQSLKVNGKEWDRNWVTWDEVFAEGGALEFVLGAEPVQWDTGDLPPSPGSEAFAGLEGREGANESGKSGGSRSRGGGVSSGTIIGSTVGVVGFLVTAVVVFLVRRRRRRRSGQRDEADGDGGGTGSDGSSAAKSMARRHGASAMALLGRMRSPSPGTGTAYKDAS